MAPDNETVLQNVPFFEKLDDEERKTLAGQIEIVRHPVAKE